MTGVSPMAEGGQRAESALPADDGRPESDLQRWDRNFSELLQELRVAQTGVQILFGFLLTVPFSTRFTRATSTLQVVVYAVTFVACAVAAALLIAPVSRHRQMFRQGRKAELVLYGDRLAQAGLLALMVTVTGAVFLVMDVLAGLAAACPVSAAVAGVYYMLWYHRSRALFADLRERRGRMRPGA
jgi:Family of unknown function (DUF6328)